MYCQVMRGSIQGGQHMAHMGFAQPQQLSVLRLTCATSAAQGSIAVWRHDGHSSHSMQR